MRAPLPFEETVFRRLPLGCLLAAAAAGLAFGPGWSSRAAAMPWLVSLVVVGLPHGAADLAIARRLGGTAAAVRLFAGYIAVMGLVFGGFVLFPIPLILLFTAVSIWHFGMAHADCQSPPIAAAWWPRMRAAIARALRNVAETTVEPPPVLGLGAPELPPPDYLRRLWLEGLPGEARASVPIDDLLGWIVGRHPDRGSADALAGFTRLVFDPAFEARFDGGDPRVHATADGALESCPVQLSIP